MTNMELLEHRVQFLSGGCDRRFNAPSKSLYESLQIEQNTLIAKRLQREEFSRLFVSCRHKKKQEMICS